jgi:CRISPR-associated protein Csm3
MLDEDAMEELKAAASLYDMEFDYSDVKWENVIDRQTGTAKGGGLRQMERVPQGAIFDFELVYDIYNDALAQPQGKTILRLEEHLQALADALELLEDDYLGGQGSRGYGKVTFKTNNEQVLLKLIQSTYRVVRTEEEVQDSHQAIWQPFAVFRDRITN